MKQSSRRAASDPGRTQAPGAPAEKIDLLKLHKADYVAPRQPVLIALAPARYLAVEGTGGPGGEVFQSRIGALYGVAFTVKMTRKFAGRGDYTVSRLECRYLNLEADGASVDPSTWHWQLLIRTPDFITPDDLAAAVATLRKRGKAADADRVALATLEEGRCVQMLHTGPYEREGGTLDVMREFATGQGLRFAGPHHEIYISDPRRIEPAKLKTILRMPVRPDR